MSGPCTPSQTVGPFYSIGFAWLERPDLAEGGASADSRITVRGRVIEGDGKPVPDAVLEIWQADAQGRYTDQEESADSADSTFFGFGRVPVNAQGEFCFTTIKPGSVVGWDGAKHAPHLAISIFMRGLLRRLVTRVYFPNEPLNQNDPVLAVVPAERRDTLIATANEAEKHSLVWDVHLQGENETVFFDC